LKKSVLGIIVIAFFVGTIISPNFANATVNQCSHTHLPSPTVIWTAICDLQSQINNLKTDIQSEIAARKTADTNLQTQINSISNQSCPPGQFVTGFSSGNIQCQIDNDTRQCITPPLNLVDWWPADSNTNDLAGSHTGTISGGVTFAPGKVAQAFSFDGTGSVGVGSLGISNDNQPFSIIAWVNPSASAINDGLPHVIVAEGSTPNNSVNGEFMTHFDIVGSNGLGELEIEIGVTQTSSAIKNTSPIVHPGQWSLVAVTYDGSRTADGIKIYINGVLQPDTIVRNDMGDASPRDQWAIGSQIGEFYSFVGLIDETEIFNRVITQQEIQSEFNADSAGKCKPS